MPGRPLSPHLSVYRFAYTMTLSILHRIAGAAISVGFLVFAGWLLAAAAGVDAYAAYAAVLDTPLLRLALAGWLVAYVYHFGNGIRHLFWDAGYGLERAQARASGRLLVAGVVIVAAALLYGFFFAAGGAS